MPIGESLVRSKNVVWYYHLNSGKSRRLIGQSISMTNQKANIDFGGSTRLSTQFRVLPFLHVHVFVKSCVDKATGFVKNHVDKATVSL